MNEIRRLGRGDCKEKMREEEIRMGDKIRI
jgi:hypothetical protein